MNMRIAVILTIIIVSVLLLLSTFIIRCTGVSTPDSLSHTLSSLEIYSEVSEKVYSLVEKHIDNGEWEDAGYLLDDIAGFRRVLLLYIDKETNSQITPDETLARYWLRLSPDHESYDQYLKARYSSHSAVQD